MNHHALSMLGLLFAVGFVGSWHCAIMCGPVASALARRGNIKLYHAGRFFSYVGAGALAGAVGANLFKVESFNGKVAVGVFLTLFFVLPFFSVSLLKRFKYMGVQKIYKFNSSLFVFGLASVLLPCGWLWSFLAGAAASGSPFAGAIVTGVLWATSLPALALLPQYFQRATRGQNPTRQRTVQIVLSTAGIYAIWSHLFLN